MFLGVYVSVCSMLTYIYIYIHVYAHANMGTHIHVYICIYTHRHKGCLGRLPEHQARTLKARRCWPGLLRRPQASAAASLSACGEGAQDSGNESVLFVLQGVSTRVAVVVPSSASINISRPNKKLQLACSILSAFGGCFR